MANRNLWTSPQRLYLDKDGKVVSANDPNRVTLLVGEGGVIPRERAVELGILEEATPAEEKVNLPSAESDDDAEAKQRNAAAASKDIKGPGNTKAR